MSATELIAKEIAQQNVERFVRKFGEPHKLLAYHAALPLLLTPELLNYLRTEFLYGQVDWVAEVDLLLSPLCVPVGHELYAMDTAARAYLLEEMELVIGRERMQAVARLLLVYVKYLSLNHPFMGVHELEAQQWAAMVVLDDRRETAVSQIVKAFQECAANDGGSGQGLINKAEMARLSHLTQELAPQLREYQSLIAYAQMVGNALDDPNDINPEDLAATYEVLPDVHLSIPDGLASNRKSTKSTFPTIQEFPFEVATIEFEEAFAEQVQTDSEPFVPEIPEIQLYPFRYQVAKIRVTESKETKGILGIGAKSNQKKIEIVKSPREWRQFVEQIAEDLMLEMVYVPSGDFVMGASKKEERSYDNERPQHSVAIPAFLMGKYPITQEQYEAVMGTNPSYFKHKPDSPLCPVENVSWEDAQEFCKKLSKLTGREYKLPSEAQWEYACRAGTTTPFHFGETISTKVANYNGNNTYGIGEKGEYRKKTTPVGYFKVANEFGLYDMHGNVWEWCEDDWHGNYKGSPTDDTVWIDAKSKENNNTFHPLRGGSWNFNPEECRSASRNGYSLGQRTYDFGFRVISFAPGLT
ncbi:MAG: formylglycine-generating enzyme family protein [Pseudanabaena sp. M135S2SP2A07QC]|nr:formylglycine-generating enzyme family protein [Pseudanabaena sp. M090S1SP2A07QC]MCA6504972.1 formylglycine-generating enzyme family protein [Pseudanabaena sp. M172S2SP2A07QC]MCA6520768.1 formylglycine-generating enzyme family protein [Pseudanabaena sp. M051S1SP2A07QC]MCA6526355.1 formylglycine-generating enzyme family protein [Pseudanabaena sp. M179S2SP2A07QC]MCA6532439.1 formylglycine-generating enzyme family protein [Pseudanabaena sp. M125S2SP2A07QC]MCA6537143.1 formylglycine-generating 